MRNYTRLFKRERGTWGLAVVTLMLAGLSLWSSKLLYKTKTDKPSTPSATSNCTLTFNLPTPIPCNRDIDIVGMTIDRSSSMNALETDGRTKLAWAKEAALTFTNMLKASGTTTVKMAVNSFGAQGNDGTGVLDSTYNSLVHTSLTNNYDTMLTAINNVRYIHSGTCIMCGLRLSNNQVNTLDPAKKVAIIISDGRANHIWDGTAPGSTVSKQAAINEANAGRAKGVQYHVIGYGSTTSPADETTLRAIAGSNGTYQYKPNATDWSTAFLSILNNICTTSGTTITPTRSVVATPTSTTGTVGSQVLPVADAYVTSSSPSTNYGSSTSLQVDYSSPTAITYMRFDLTSLANTTITRATLKVYVTNSTTGSINFKNLSSSWTESAVTYNTKPTLSTLIKSVTNPGATGTWTSIDLTTYVNNHKGSTAAFAIDSTSTDGFNFTSRNSSSNKPYLLIQ